MAWEIDNFAVKPEGLFANWRWARVMTDNLGNITTEDIPGREAINLNCIAEYKKSDRQYTHNSLITSFCNLTTFTNYRIYAQDCKPFAYVQTDLNAAKCGYQVPIVEPYIPPNPFGSPNYGFYAYLNFCDDKNVAINVRIYKRNYVGDTIKINNGGPSPVVISYKNSNDNKFAPIRSCELQLTLVADGTLNFEQFYVEDEREFKIQVIKNGITKFFGFATASEATEQFNAPPYDVILRATDGLGALKKVNYPLPIGSRMDLRQTFLEVLCYCLAMTNLNLELATVCNLYESKMTKGIDYDPLSQASINPQRLLTKGKVLNCYEVLEKICLQFGAFMVQDNGVWHFVRHTELSHIKLRKRQYTHKGFLLSAQYVDARRTATCKGADISMLDDNPILKIGNAYKRAEVIVDFGEVPFLFFNGDFEQFDGSNFPGWAKYGGMRVSRIEKQITTTTGKIPSGDFALQFDEIANNAKYLEAMPVRILKGDKITFSFNVGKTTSNTAPQLSQEPNTYTGRPSRSGNPINPAGIGIDFKLRIKLGEYYLANPEGDNVYVWMNQLVTCTIKINNPSETLDVYTVKIDLPEAPVDADLTVQLYGFEVVGTYYPIYVDNISVTKAGENKTVGRVLYISQQDGYYTNKPDEIKLLFGDHISGAYPARPSRTVDGRRPTSGSIEIKEDQYAIYTKDGSYSKAWRGIDRGTWLPIGLVLARSILKAYQKPFRFLESSFLGDNISYLDIFNVNLPNNTDFSGRFFTLLSGDFDLKAGEVKNANYVEIFSKSIKTIDIILPGKDGDAIPPIVQNPNPPPALLGGIFTAQFTNEFK